MADCAGNTQCFIAGTLVLCEDGYKKIEDIQVGDKVLAYDEQTGEQGYKEVVRLFRNESKEWVGLTVNGEEIVSTPGHKYYLPKTKNWVSAMHLQVGDTVLLSNGKQSTIESKCEIVYDTPQTTYNFEVADYHTYYVGTGVLVHNNCRGANHLKPDPNATGAHSVFKTDSTGSITNYATYEVNPLNPTGFDEVLRFDGIGGIHRNSMTGVGIPTPHMHGKYIIGGVRAALLEEIPSSLWRLL